MKLRAAHVRVGGVAGWVASGPDKVGTCQYCQMVRVRRVRGEGIREEPVCDASLCGTGSNLVDMGRSAVRTGLCVEAGVRRRRPPAEGASPRPQFCVGRGGRRGKAGCLPPRSVTSEHGNRFPTRPHRNPIQGCGGQAHRLLWGRGRGRAAVVLRGRENRSHGEGRQRVSRKEHLSCQKLRR